MDLKAHSGVMGQCEASGRRTPALGQQGEIRGGFWGEVLQDPTPRACLTFQFPPPQSQISGSGGEGSFPSQQPFGGMTVLNNLSPICTCLGSSRDSLSSYS